MKPPPTVRVWGVSSTISEAGRRDPHCEPVDVPPDKAHELAEAPVVEKKIVGRRVHIGNFIETFWQISALGFIEAEAIEAHDRAVEELEATLFTSAKEQP